MKAILFYSTLVMIFITVCTVELSALTFLLILLDTQLVSLCCKVLSLREILHFIGYDVWYKYFRS